MQFDGFKTGDVVKLKSGGPPMTVGDWPEAEVFDHTSDEIPCMWFEGTTLNEVTIKSSELRLV